MKILSNKQFEELKSFEKTNRFLSNGFRAMNLCLDFEKTIIGIMKQCNLKEIELPKEYLISEDILEVAENQKNHSFILEIKEIGDDKDKM